MEYLKKVIFFSLIAFCCSFLIFSLFAIQSTSNWEFLYSPSLAFHNPQYRGLHVNIDTLWEDCYPPIEWRDSKYCRTFMPHRYIKDDEKVYIELNKPIKIGNNEYKTNIEYEEIIWVDLDTFWVLDVNILHDEWYKGYALDKNYVYYKWKKLLSSHPQSFGYVWYNYAKDINNVYYLWDIIPNADPVSFHLIAKTRPIEGIVDELYIGQDKNMLYSNGKNINNSYEDYIDNIFLKYRFKYLSIVLFNMFFLFGILFSLIIWLIFAKIFPRSIKSILILLLTSGFVTGIYIFYLAILWASSM